MATELLTSRDMARLYCDACSGCGDCCCGMGDTIHLDPYDCNALTKNLHRDFASLLQDTIGLHEEQGLVLPHLKMTDAGQCPFLDSARRCSIHEFRPGLCRLFPLGRNYDPTTLSFSYFVVPDGCDMPGKAKIRISRWLGVPDLPRYEKFVADWHFYVRDVQAVLARTQDPASRSALTKFVLQVFFVTPYDPSRDFYELFSMRLNEARMVL